ncbi:hypothetical protein GUJ93_ZPchr0007g4402 [Zizania palustris]|uniref:Uncharacterized protein n=1 Tax=Zizania palustris TaxID=103762 RepID=A0A8J5T772_ZIZPA|nr:hypothetical protein GUJ93_ZPchr0007g4402 [Zizania palustris]
MHVAASRACNTREQPPSFSIKKEHMACLVAGMWLQMQPCCAALQRYSWAGGQARVSAKTLQAARRGHKRSGEKDILLSIEKGLSFAGRTEKMNK